MSSQVLGTGFLSLDLKLIDQCFTLSQALFISNRNRHDRSDSEEVIAYDTKLQDFLKPWIDVGIKVRACKWCSNDYGVSDSQAIGEGCTPMVW